MKQFFYRYESDILFSTPVSAHSWLLRCMPKEEPFQRAERAFVRVSVVREDGEELSLPVCHGRDAFGNAVQWGYVAGAHCRFSILSEGVMRQTPYRICGTAHDMFLEHTALTRPDADMERFAGQVPLRAAEESCEGSLPRGKVLERALSLCDAVYRHMSYVPGATTVNTTAGQAFALGQGVCQDYAHILLSLLRCSGIPTRYACGYLAGEGAGHAWVEFFDQGVWRGLDPANNRLLSCGCIKVAHGRDSADCPVNRGVFTGRAAQQNTLAIKVEEV